MNINMKNMYGRNTAAGAEQVRPAVSCAVRSAEFGSCLCCCLSDTGGWHDPVRKRFSA